MPVDAPILILGTGAMASLFAARLSAAGFKVALLGSWPEGLAALRSRGVELVHTDAPSELFPVSVFTRPADCPAVQFALVLVKAWQTPRAAAQLAECLAPGGLVLTLQNGAGNRAALAEVLGSERVALGVTTAGAALVGPGQVRPGGKGGISVEKHPRAAPLLAALRSAGFAVEETPDAESLVWSKLVINAAINPLTALLRVANGELLTRPDAHLLLAALAREAAAVAAARGTVLTFSDPVAAAEAVAKRTAANRSSMLQDVLRGAPTEIDAICGTIVQEGVRLGVPTPVNETVWRLVRGLKN